MSSITAVIVARLGSKRIPHKNLQKIAGQTLLMRKVHQCLKIKDVENVVVIGDIESAKEEVENAGAVFERQADRHCEGKGNNVNEMVKDALSYFDSDYVLWAHPTNPFINEDRYQAAIDVFNFSKTTGHDSLFSVNKLKGHFWTQSGRPINHNPMSPLHVIANELPPIYSQNGGIFIRKYQDMAKDGSFVGAKPAIYPLSETEGWDIDYPWQLEFAQQSAERE